MNQRKLKIDEVDTQIDAIAAAYPEDSPEYAALHDIQLYIIRVAARNLPPMEAATKIKQLLDTHRGNPALHADMLKVLNLALGAISEFIHPEEVRS